MQQRKLIDRRPPQAYPNRRKNARGKLKALVAAFGVMLAALLLIRA